MLREYGEFYPYGAFMRTDGTVVDLSAEDPENDQPKSTELIYLLCNSLRELAAGKKCKAVAIVCNVSIQHPRTQRKTSAIQISIEHKDNYSREIVFPYEIADGTLSYGETLVQERKPEIF